VGLTAAKSLCSSEIQKRAVEGEQNCDGLPGVRKQATIAHPFAGGPGGERRRRLTQRIVQAAGLGS
jgi:hypothetical protein